MQLLIILLMLCLFTHDQAQSWISTEFAWPILLLWVVLPKLILAIGYTLACRRTYRRLALPNAARRLRRLERLGGALRIAAVLLFASDLHFGLLISVRAGIQTLTGITHPILLDEVVVLLPTLALWGLGWWAYYPIDRRLREAAMMRRFDQGLPVYPMWTRWQYVLSQYRYQVALILVPLLFVIAWSEMVRLAGTLSWAWVTPDTEPWWTLGGFVLIFLFAPLIIRLTWDTVPLPDGDVRNHLLSMCKTHRVRVRELLLWRTYGGMINAAVMGLIGPLRFILITDALLQQMPGEHVEAVMAHELAHVCKRHMLWLLISAVALMSVVETAAVVVLASNGVRFDSTDQGLTVTANGVNAVTAGPGLPWLPGIDSREAMIVAVMAVAAVVWAIGFGWVSRRIERQADSFAVSHLVKERDGDTVEPRDAQTMIDALQHVADLNHIRTEKHSWRHGSIAWRQDYLRSLVGSAIHRLPIDRQMRWVNSLSVVAVAAIFLLQAWLS